MSEDSGLSYDYVVNYMFKKLSATFDKYRDILPVIDEVEQAIVSKEPSDGVDIVLIVAAALKNRCEDSPLVGEIFENFKRDFYHGLEPERVEKHEGRYYIDSVGD
jgi:hypothetical protein